MVIKTRKQLLAAYKDPINFTSADKIQSLKKIYFWIAIVVLVVGIGLFYLVFGIGFVEDNSRRFKRQSGFGLSVMAVVTPVYGVVRLFTIKRCIIKHQKQRLVEKRLPIDLDTTKFL